MNFAFSDYALRLNLKGIANISIPAGQTVSHEFTVQQRTILTGAEYFRDGGNESDTITFRIKVGGQVAGTFADEIFMGSQGRYEFYQAVLAAGHVIEIIYKNSGSAEAKFRYNLISHVDK